MSSVEIVAAKNMVEIFRLNYAGWVFVAESGRDARQTTPVHAVKNAAGLEYRGTNLISQAVTSGGT